MLHARTTIAQQHFEAVPVAPAWSIAAGAANISTATGAGEVPSNQRIHGGARSWQVNSGNASLDLDSLSTVGHTGIQAIAQISSTSTVANNGAEFTDDLRMKVALNEASLTGTADITVSGTDDPRRGYNNAINTVTKAGSPSRSRALPERTKARRTPTVGSRWSSSYCGKH